MAGYMGMSHSEGKRGRCLISWGEWKGRAYKVETGSLLPPLSRALVLENIYVVGLKSLAEMNDVGSRKSGW